jgi:uncharacterized protein (DUF1499 family)
MNNDQNKQIHPLTQIGLFLSLLAMAIAVVSVVGYRMKWWRQLQAFDIFGWATFVAGIAFLLCIIGLFKARPSGRFSGMLLGILGILLSLPIMTSAFLFTYSAKIYPPINDISTDLLNPPVFWDVPNPTEYPGSKTAKIQKAEYPDLQPLKLSISPKTAFTKALKVVKEKGWKIVGTDEEEGRIEAVSSSLLYGFKDEVVIRITPDKSGIIIDMRSRSRIGRIDRGANARRIRSFMKALKKEL